MQHQIEEIDGISLNYINKLEKLGITTVETLLEKGSSARGRNELATAIGVSNSTILRWINLADLFQIQGVGQGYSKLLEAAAIDTVDKLSNSFPEVLYIKLVKINEERELLQKLPSLAQLEDWIIQAKNRPSIMEEKQLTINQNYSDWSIEWCD